MSLPPSPEWQRNPDQLHGYHYYRSQAESPVERQNLLLHVVLFLATLGTTTMAGAFQQGVDPFSDPVSLMQGLPFAVTLMSILLFHEMGHYLFARKHGVYASLPYFIPGLPHFVGTFGAFIRMKSPPANRRALFDVGAAGPWAGVLLAIPAAILGLSLSEVRPLNPFEEGLILGDSFLFSALTRVVLGVSGSEVTIILHPIALAGWFGLFVTFLNLLPVGQLDGGHVVYSLFGRLHRWISRAFLFIVIPVLGLQGWLGWFFWIVLLSLLGIDHPPTRDLFSSLDPRRKVYAWCTVGLFVLTFMPVPISVSEGIIVPNAERIPVAYSVKQPPATRPRFFLYRP
jgi:membrane-associated protease RseP (regulator of RpoE activity)